MEVLFFIKLSMQGVVDYQKIRGARGYCSGRTPPKMWIILAKMQGASYLYSLAPPELIASIQYVKAVSHFFENRFL